ncbi:MAG TPA: MopE-related protein, partial [Polyangiaceae bacterium]
MIPGCGARTGLELDSDDDGVASRAVERGIGGVHSAENVTRPLVGGSSGGTASGGARATSRKSSGSGGASFAVGGQGSSGRGTSRVATSGGLSAGGTSATKTVGGSAMSSGVGGRGRPVGGSSTGGTYESGGAASGGSRSSSTRGGAGLGGTGGTTTISVSGSTSNADALCPAALNVPTGCRPELVEGFEGTCNGLDDNCDGSVDEGCPCTPGTVKPCFAGPPGRRNVGACRDGLQVCETTTDRRGRYGKCLGGIAPQAETCDQLDNDCNGCRDELRGCVPVGSCPGPSDARIAQLQPFSTAKLNVRDFYDGDAIAYAWSIEGGPCDQIAPLGAKSFDLINPSAATAMFVPKLSGDYTVTLKVTALSGESFSCNWVIPVRGPGLRIEMCYPESAYRDLDLYLKRLSTPTRWFVSNSVYDPNVDECAWHNCEAETRGGEMVPSRPGVRVDWGY